MSDTETSPAPDLASSFAQASEEQRDEPRFHVHWHVSASLDGHGVCQGFLKDISVKGATLYLDHNPEHIKTGTLQIQAPPLEAHTAPHLIEVEVRFIYSIHDSAEQMFRAGVLFKQFRVETDQTFLENRLVKFEIPAA